MATQNNKGNVITSQPSLRGGTTKQSASLKPKLRFKEFEGEWEQKKLGDLVTIKSGISPSRYNFDEIGLYPFLKVEELNNCEKYQFESRFYSNENHNLIKKHSIIFPKRGAAILNNKVRILSTDALMDSNLMSIDSDEGKLFYEFLYYKIFKEKLYKIADTSTIPQINNKHIEPYKIKIPNLPEQQKIANFLTAVDTKLQQLTTKKELLAQYKKGVMQQLFSQQLRFKADDGGDFADWEEKRLGEVLELQIREIPKPKENYLAIGIRSHVKGTFQKPDSDPNKIAMEKLFVVKENDLIVNITFAWEGAIAIVKKEDEGGLVSHRFPTYTFKKNESCHQYFKQIIIDKKIRFTLDLISPGGAGRNRVLSKKEFLKIKWSFPSLKEQQKIANYLSAIDKKIETVQRQITQTQAFKKGLLQGMFV